MNTQGETTTQVKLAGNTKTQGEEEDSPPLAHPLHSLVTPCVICVCTMVH